MSAEDRAALVQQMKADTQSRQQQLISIVQKMMTGQAATASVANGTTVMIYGSSLQKEISR